jgi:uncharacterized membrane protein YjgN (DUF898 family)
MENPYDSFILEPVSENTELPIRSQTPVFTGSGGEYFRIWIVNVALTVLTLGIYAAWAKVRTRRYFYANTVLDGQPFDYLARPGAIFRGYMIVGGALLVMNLLNNFLPRFGTVFSAAALSCVPYLLFKAHRFKARYSAYRNLRFRFTGDVRGAYAAYAVFPLAASVSLLFMLSTFLGSYGAIVFMIVMISGMGLAIVYPYMMFLQRRYFHDNMAFGKTESSFTGETGPFYGIYLRSLALFIALPLIAGIIVAVSAGTVKSLGESSESLKIAGLAGTVLLTYVLMAFLAILVQQYIFARTYNYSWGHSRLGQVRFLAQIRARDLAWIRFTNIMAIFLSLGLLIPWAKVRRTRYVLSKTTVLFRGEMEAFEADVFIEEGAVGDTVADFFDWDIGW